MIHTAKEAGSRAVVGYLRDELEAYRRLREMTMGGVNRRQGDVHRETPPGRR